MSAGPSEALSSAQNPSSRHGDGGVPKCTESQKAKELHVKWQAVDHADMRNRLNRSRPSFSGFLTVLSTALLLTAKSTTTVALTQLFQLHKAKRNVVRAGTNNLSCHFHCAQTSTSFITFANEHISYGHLSSFRTSLLEAHHVMLTNLSCQGCQHNAIACLSEFISNSPKNAFSILLPGWRQPQIL